MEVNTRRALPRLMSVIMLPFSAVVKLVPQSVVQVVQSGRKELVHLKMEAPSGELCKPEPP